MTADTLHFEAERHLYTLMPRGISLPSVSDIIRPLADLSSIPPATLEFARSRGHAVHKACELLDLGTLDEATLDERLVNYVDAWRAFCDEWSMKWEMIERPMYHKGMLYAGTPDRVGVSQGHKPKRVLVDIKATAMLNPAVAVQMSAYNLMLDKQADELWSVRLMPDGSFERTVHAPEISTFYACHNIFNWKKKNA